MEFGPKFNLDKNNKKESKDGSVEEKAEKDGNLQTELEDIPEQLKEDYLSERHKLSGLQKKLEEMEEKIESGEEDYSKEEVYSIYKQIEKTQDKIDQVQSVENPNVTIIGNYQEVLKEIERVEKSHKEVSEKIKRLEADNLEDSEEYRKAMAKKARLGTKKGNLKNISSIAQQSLIPESIEISEENEEVEIDEVKNPEDDFYVEKDSLQKAQRSRTESESKMGPGKFEENRAERKEKGENIREKIEDMDVNLHFAIKNELKKINVLEKKLKDMESGKSKADLEEIDEIKNDLEYKYNILNDIYKEDSSSVILSAYREMIQRRDDLEHKIMKLDNEMEKSNSEEDKRSKESKSLLIEKIKLLSQKRDLNNRIVVTKNAHIPSEDHLDFL